MCAVQTNFREFYSEAIRHSESNLGSQVVNKDGSCIICVARKTKNILKSIPVVLRLSNFLPNHCDFLVI